MGIRQRIEVIYSFNTGEGGSMCYIFRCILWVQILMNSVSPAEARSLVSGYEMLTSPEKMGEKFKLFSVTSSPVHVPVPFFENEKLFK